MQGLFIPYSVNNGQYNMDFDEKILNYSISKQLNMPVFRLYGWSPKCVSLGRNQKENINQEFCKAKKIEIVRRLTGGRALLHDNELTYSFVCPISFLQNGATVIQSYKEISGALALGLKQLGINAEFPEEKKTATHFEYCMSLSTGADLSVNGKKIVGSAQFRKQGYILQHGSIMFGYDKETIKNIFGEEPDTLKITTINETAPQVTLDELCNSLKSGIEKAFEIKLIEFNDIDKIYLK